jgi:molecular chaperone HtpG
LDPGPFQEEQTEMSKTTQPETRRFEAETQDLLGLMIHSLYTEKDIFLRELISNASDALDKLRHASLTDESLQGGDEELEIRLEVDAEAGTLSVIDNGIGMTRDEMAENLGTIARSGTKAFLEALREKGAEEAPALIGQFGVGFYSSFMVADEVTVVSRRAGTSEGACWRSKADGEYTLEDCEAPQHGTRVTLHLKPSEPDFDAREFLVPDTLRGVVKRHSDFVAWPIRMEVERAQPVLDDEGTPKPGETVSTKSIETFNSQRPLWARPKNEVTAEEHSEFYRHLSHDWNEPYDVLHFTAESPVEYTALLYVPKQRPMDLFSEDRQKSRLALYVKRVLIMPACEDLLPPWLRFVRGIVDCPDLPLNVSRQTLQANPVVSKIQRHLIAKVLKSLGTKLEKDREGYTEFFDSFGRVVKEGIYHGADDDQRLSKLCLFHTTHGEEQSTLTEYVARAPEGQDKIHCLVGTDLETLRRSPHLEAYKAKGREVVFLADPVDEWMLQRLVQFDGKALAPIDQGSEALESDEDKQAREAKEEEQKDLLEALKEHLADHVAGVRFSSRLEESPAVLVSERGAMGPAMEQVMRELGRDLPPARRTLELNPEHPVVKRLIRMHVEEPGSQLLLDYGDLLHGQALLAEGRTPPDPTRFGKLIADLMLAAPSGGEETPA